MKKILIAILLIAAVAYGGTKIFTNNRDQLAAVMTTSQRVVSGTVSPLSVAVGGTLTVTLTFAQPYSASSFPLTAEFLGYDPIPLTQSSASGNTVTFTAQVPTSVAPGQYEFSAINTSNRTVAWVLGDGATMVTVVAAAPVVTTPAVVVPAVVTPAATATVQVPAAVPQATTPDRTAPVISGLAASDVTYNNAKITWTTNEPASYYLEYTKVGVASPTTGTGRDENYRTSHEIRQIRLDPNTTYQFRIKAKDSAGNESVYSTLTFKTLVYTQPAAVAAATWDPSWETPAVLTNITGTPTMMFNGSLVYDDDDMVTITGRGLSKTKLYRDIKADTSSAGRPGSNRLSATDESITTTAAFFMGRAYTEMPVHNNVYLYNYTTQSQNGRYTQEKVLSNGISNPVGFAMLHDVNRLVQISSTKNHAAQLQDHSYDFKILSPLAVSEYDSVKDAMNTLYPVFPRNKIFESGRTYDVIWYSPSAIRNVDIYVENCNAGASNCILTKIASNIANTGKYSWTVPGNPGRFVGTQNKFLITVAGGHVYVRDINYGFGPNVKMHRSIVPFTIVKRASTSGTAPTVIEPVR